MPKAPGDIAQIAHQFGIGLPEAATAEYLGDSVYATFDGYQVWLRNFNGVSVHDTIAVEPPVMRALVDFARKHEAVSA